MLRDPNEKKNAKKRWIHFIYWSLWSLKRMSHNLDWIYLQWTWMHLRRTTKDTQMYCENWFDNKTNRTEFTDSSIWKFDCYFKRCVSIYRTSKKWEVCARLLFIWNVSYAPTMHTKMCSMFPFINIYWDNKIHFFFRFRCNKTHTHTHKLTDTKYSMANE